MTEFKTQGCPFCGHTVLELLSMLDPITNLPKYTVVCSRCGSHGPPSTQEHWAVTEWGSRCNTFPVATLRGYTNPKQKPGD